ncbi:MAG: TldD/PmbA family protein [Pseudomonadota bacterium]|nr:TldD/PmbA family protein [Pseudomonadota bacterium]
MDYKLNSLDILDDIIGSARDFGAEAADAVMFDSASIEFGVRLGKTEKLERAESRDLGLRVFIGKRQAVVSSTDHSEESLKEMAERCVAMARTAPEDPWCGLAERSQLETAPPDLDLFDRHEPSIEKIKNTALEAEDAARSVAGIRNSEGADVGWSRSNISLATTTGFSQTYTVTSQSFSASVLAGEGTEMERDYDFASAVHWNDLPSPASIGRSAGERAVKRLNPEKMSTTQAPVIFDPRISGGLVRHLLGAINGTAVARGTSFLKDRLGHQILPSSVSIMEDPRRPRGQRSKPFDAEGLPTRAKPLVNEGILETWILDLSSSRQLGCSSTGNASRGTGAPPGPAATNVWMTAGDASPAGLISDIKQGFYVTELIGMGVNGVTGDYSRGASGFWIENGAITFPVSEMTIAGNLRDMFLALTPANDLVFKYGNDAPTLRIDGMTIAGS